MVLKNHGRLKHSPCREYPELNFHQMQVNMYDKGVKYVEQFHAVCDFFLIGSKITLIIRKHGGSLCR